jgi:hypothetical protein
MADLLIAQDGAALLTEDGRLMVLQSDNGVQTGARVTLVADQVRYDVGDVAFFTATFVDRGGEPIDPTIVSFVWRLFDGTETSFSYGDDPEVELVNVGIYTFSSPEITQFGKHVCRVDGTDPYAAAERPIPVRASSFANP